MKDLIIYFDMDGVMADWEAQWLSHFPHMTLETIIADRTVYEHLKDVPTFWHDIPFIHEVMPLWDYCYNKYEIQILSAPLREDMENSLAGKESWLDKHLGHYEFKRNFALPENKQNYATANSLLIDDRDYTIAQFKARGGIGIHHEPHNSPRTLSILRSMGL